VPGCPPAERVWDAVRGGVAGRECREIVEHTAACGACAEAWRLAVDLRRELASAAPGGAAERARRRWAPLAAAAGLLLALGLAWRLGLPVAKPAYREPPGTAVQSLIPEDRTLRRERFLLRWSSDAAGARYNLLVSREDLEPVARARGLAEPRFLVPVAALADLPGGARLLWQVEVLLPDGERRLSPTFFARLE
jgi:hypothetical protein